MNSPKISILLPCLNGREFLEPRIDSLLQQTFSDWEAIVLDSQSTDGSWEMFNDVASTDPRFRLYTVPREGVYAALNRGIGVANGEFVHIATCDDTMLPEFLTTLLNTFDVCPDAGIAACDLLFIDRNGHTLSPTTEDLVRHLSKRAIRELLDLDTVRTAFPGEKQNKINYRPVPHDCLLHFSGRSVYCSLTQLLIRRALFRVPEPFQTTVGSIADFGWLLNATSRVGTVHLPQKLATWRFHGDQLSIRRDHSRSASIRMMCEGLLPEIRERCQRLLTPNDYEAVALAFKTRLSTPVFKRAYYWLEAVARLLWMILESPVPVLRALRRVKFRFGTRRHTLLPMIFQKVGLVPKIYRDGNDGGL
jgi:glycosyltransferase involved in cell wall biosynthesis